MNASVTVEKNGSVVGAVKYSLSKFGSVEGRASRSEYWYLSFAIALGFALASFLDAVLGTEWLMIDNGRLVPYFGHLQFIWTIGTIVPWVTVGVRRLHDIEKTGSWLLLWFVPVAGWILLLYWHCCAGTQGENRYGKEPIYFV